MKNLILSNTPNFVVFDLLIGVIASIIASIIILCFSLIMKPKIRISKVICVRKIKDKKYEFKIKIVNLSVFLSVTNFEKELRLVIQKDKGLEQYVALKESYDDSKIYLPSRFWCFFHKNNSCNDYAIRLKYIYEGDLSYIDFLKFAVWGESNVFNAKKDKQILYKNRDLLLNYQFITGKSCKAYRIDIE